MKGRVKWWSREKGYGFVEITENDSIFAHLHNEQKNKYEIQENQEIEFEIIENDFITYLKILNYLKN